LARAGVLIEGDGDTLDILREMRDELAAEMRAEGQKP